MTSQPAGASVARVDCFECGREIPSAEGPTCRACQRQVLIADQNADILTQLRQQTAHQKSIRGSVFFLAFVVFLTLVMGFVNAAMANNARTSNSQPSKPTSVSEAVQAP